MTGAEAAHGRSEVARLTSPIASGKARSASMARDRAGSGRSRNGPESLPGCAIAVLAEAHVPVAGREDRGVGVRRWVSSQDGAEVLVVDELDH